MNQTLSTFLKIGITTLAIGLLLFTVAYNMTEGQATSYKAKIESVQNELPTN